MKVKVENMKSIVSGQDVPNQFIITQSPPKGMTGTIVTFQSYGSSIVRTILKNGVWQTQLDCNKWDYSRTTSKYRNQFLCETKKETQAKIDSGEYELTDLN